MTFRAPLALAAAVLAAVVCAAPPEPEQTGSGPDFTREVRPILERHCLSCHGPTRQAGGLRLDNRDGARHAVVAHDAAASPLIHRVTATDDTLRMPPPNSGLPRLEPAQIATLRAWIDAGPRWPEASGKSAPKPQTHWSLRPLRRPKPPIPARNPIDAFVRARLKRNGLTLSPPADRRTLLRRVAIDLTGLPPTPEEVAAFLADKKPGAYERVVDRLLVSPAYGERWARHWLDTIHFADSHGFEHDIGRENAWPFRDYVIDALNRDTPWPRFIREQLAADFFYPDAPQLTVALGFLGAGTFDLSAYTTAPRNFALLDRDDLVTQTMTAFASTTANCARCHDHKFDPVPQADYYALQAVFAGLTKGDRTYDRTPETARARRRWDALAAAADRADPAVLRAPENAAVVDAWLAGRRGGALWQTLDLADATSSGGAALSRRDDGAVVSGGPRPETDTVTVRATSRLRRVTALRLDVLAEKGLPMGGPGRQDNGNLHLSEFQAHVQIPGAAPRPLAFRQASADFNQAGWGIERAIDHDPKTAWGIFPAVGKSHHAVFPLAEPLELPAGATLTVALEQLHGGGHLIGVFRLSATDAPPETTDALPAEIDAALAVPAPQRTPAQNLAIAAHALRARAAAERAKLPPPAVVYAAGPRVDVPTVGIQIIAEPADTRVLQRGDLDKPREVVGPGALSAVAALPARFALKNPKDEAARRAALADWLAHRDNPLTWRSIVNRVWHYHFGRGLCDTPSDFGTMGGTPSHPELIDALAVWFRDDAHGSLKALHRQIVTSDTYRQRSAPRADGVRRDAENRLLWRQNRQRLDADSFRDGALAVSGRLDPTRGGPAVKLFTMRPGPQLTPALDYAAFDDHSPGAGRRSIYRFVWRGIADPFLEALDFPDLGLLTPTRGVSVSALQALALYNDAFVLRCSEALARRIEKQTPDGDARVVAAARQVWLRTPTAPEQRALADFARRHGLAALCRVLLNSNEFLFVE